jgi:lipopolysaccharide transport system ATP-binding protein
VLAVGDAAFQRKSISKMGDVARGGRTVLFVSHNLGAIRNLCSRALVLQHGGLAFEGDVGQALAFYEKSLTTPDSGIEASQFRGTMTEHIRFEQLIRRQRGEIVEVLDPIEEFEIELHGFATQRFPALELKVVLFRDGFPLASCHDTPHESPMEPGPFVSKIAFPANVFRPGRYSIGIGASGAMGSWLWGSDVAVLDFSDNRGGLSAERTEGAVAIQYRSERIQGH